MEQDEGFDSTVRNGGGTLETVARVTRAHDFDTQNIVCPTVNRRAV